MDKRSAIILMIIWAWVSYLAADGTTDYDSFVLVSLNAISLIVIIILSIMIWAIPPFALFLILYLLERNIDDHNGWINFSVLVGGLITLKVSDYFHQILQYIQKLNLEVIYG